MQLIPSEEIPKEFSTRYNLSNDQIVFYCLILNHRFSIATSETLRETLLSIPLSDIKDISQPDLDNSCQFSITINLANSTDEIKSNITRTHRVNQFFFMENERSEMTFHFRCESSVRVHQWIVALNETIASAIIQSDSIPTSMNSIPTISDFAILNVLGTGYSGEVLLVQHKATSKYFALKSIPKCNVMKSNRIIRTIAERNILMSASHPFITKLVSAFQTQKCLCLLLEFVPGGNLEYLIKKDHYFEDQSIRLYLAEIATALSYLHNMGIVFRDLKPSNILVGADGHLKLTDFGLAKYFINDNYSSSTEQNNPNPDGSVKRSPSFCGTHEYLAPEMIDNKGYDFAIDWWALGILAYQLYYGFLPFRTMNLNRLYEMIRKQPVKFFKPLDPDIKDFITGLLVKNPRDRLGCNTIMHEHEIFEHFFFKDIDWAKVYNKEYAPNFIPLVSDSNPVLNFDQNITSKKPSILEENQTCVDFDKKNVIHVSDFSFSTIDELTAKVKSETL